MRPFVLALALLFALPAFAAPDAGSPDAGADAGESDPFLELPLAEPIAFKAGVSKAEVKLGEPFTLSIEAKHSGSETWSLRAGADLGPFEIRSQKTETTGDEPKTTLLRFELQPFETGELQIPRLHLVVESHDTIRRFEVPPQTVVVHGVIDRTGGEPTMKEDARPLPTRHRFSWLRIGILAALILATILAIYLKRRRDRPPPPPPPKPRDAPDVEALARLQALWAEGLVATGRGREFFFRLTEIARDYVGRRYGFDALEQTTDELLLELRRRPTQGLDYDAFAAFARNADLVKFAKIEPTDGECKTAFDAVTTLVQRTRPPPPVEGGRS